MSIAFVYCGCMLLLMTPSVVLLLVCIGVGGCLCPIFLMLEDGLAGVDIQCTKIGFGGGGHDGLDELGDVEDRAIVFGVGGVGGQEKVSAGTAACLGFA